MDYWFSIPILLFVFYMMTRKKRVTWKNQKIPYIILALSFVSIFAIVIYLFIWFN